MLPVSNIITVIFDRIIRFDWGLQVNSRNPAQLRAEVCQIVNVWSHFIPCSPWHWLTLGFSFTAAVYTRHQWKQYRKHRRKYYGKCDVIYRYLHIELIWSLLMVQYIQNNVIMKWTARFIRFTGWVPLKYGSTTTPSIIAHCQKTPMSSVVFHIAIPQTSNIRRTPSFDLPTVEFSKRVSIISRALY